MTSVAVGLSERERRERTDLKIRSRAEGTLFRGRRKSLEEYILFVIKRERDREGDTRSGTSRQWRALVACGKPPLRNITSGKVTAGNNHITNLESTLRIDCIALDPLRSPARDFTSFGEYAGNKYTLEKRVNERMNE